MAVRVQIADFDLGQEVDELTRGDCGLGAVATFVGLVRDVSQGAGGVAGMLLEYYPGMTERALADIEQQARSRWKVDKVLVIHRYGRLMPGEHIVLVAVAGAHRGDCFAACEFIMDYLKTRAPFWKKEQTAQGERWVESRQEDDRAAGRWDKR